MIHTASILKNLHHSINDGGVRSRSHYTSSEPAVPTVGGQIMFCFYKLASSASQLCFAQQLYKRPENLGKTGCIKLLPGNYCISCPLCVWKKKICPVKLFLTCTVCSLSNRPLLVAAERSSLNHKFSYHYFHLLFLTQARQDSCVVAQSWDLKPPVQNTSPNLASF